MNTSLTSWIAVLGYFGLIIGGIMTEFFSPLEYSILFIMGGFLIYKGIKEPNENKDWRKQ
jgi:hypothetical protein